MDSLSCGDGEAVRIFGRSEGKPQLSGKILCFLSYKESKPPLFGGRGAARPAGGGEGGPGEKERRSGSAGGKETTGEEVRDSLGVGQVR